MTLGKSRQLSVAPPTLAMQFFPTPADPSISMNASVIVWDIETVPDLRGFAAAKGLVGKLDEEVRAEMGEKFPKLIYHSIVCIGALVAQRREDHWEVTAVGAPNVAER